MFIVNPQMFRTLMVTPENTIEAVTERYESEKYALGWWPLCRDSDVWAPQPAPVSMQRNPNRIKSHGYGYSEGENRFD
jgi:hypothetical protein